MAHVPSIKSPAELKSLTLAEKSGPSNGTTHDHAYLDDSDEEPLGDEADADAAQLMNTEVRRRYIKDKKVGSGTYANVYKGHEAANPTRLVAIKKIKFTQVQKEMGIPPDAIREIKALQELSHPNVISLLAVFSSKGQNINMVLEFLPLGDMEMMIKDANILYTVADMKAWMLMLCRAVWFCHENYILHRDIKPNNILIAADGEMKLADFGLCRTMADPGRKMSTQVITTWYRPPELLYGCRYYSGAVDVWSVGATFAELVTRRPYMPSQSDAGQLVAIYNMVGTPTEDNWPGVSQLPFYRDSPPTGADLIPVKGKAHYAAMFPTIGALGQDLMQRMFALDPRKRITARQTLQHQWWGAEPRPTNKEDLPRKPGGDKEKKMGEDLKQTGRVGGGPDKVARKLDFGK